MEKPSLIKNNHKEVFQFVGQLRSYAYIDNLGLTSAKIEQECSKYHLNMSNRTREQAIEKRNDFPSFVAMFYYYIFYYKKIPTQQQYIAFYKFVNRDWVTQHVPKELDVAFEARLSRTYPSLVRDIHFYHVLKESKMFEGVLFTVKLDVHYKIDVLIQVNQKKFGLQLHTKTKNAYKYFAEKEKRTNAIPNVQLVDVPIDLNTAKNIKTKTDTLKLYTYQHAENIFKQVSSM